jgi:DNA-directed RNA polymerase subunit RPC12/RpoP
MSDRSDSDEDLPACPNCGSENVVPTPALQTEYRCLECNTEFTGTAGGWAFE